MILMTLMTLMTLMILMTLMTLMTLKSFLKNFIIYLVILSQPNKSTITLGKTWQPFQYYSADCRAIFGRQQRTPISRANEQEPLCLNEYDQNDKTSTRIAFSTLADRPSAEDFENSPVLQVR